VCTLLLTFDPTAPEPIVVAANRDEFRSRPADEPHDWGGGVFAGRDRRAGGTWLAVARGRLAAVTNVRGVPPRPEAPSRGLLPLAALRGELPDRFDAWNAFNLVIATPESVRVVTHGGAGGATHERMLGPGRYAIVNDPYGDASPRAASARSILEHRGACFDALATHGDALLALCGHGDDYGTVSATVVAMDRDGRVDRYLHRTGPPCVGAEHDFGAPARRATDRDALRPI
jgi:uncharacterized protein with NRDE domain